MAISVLEIESDYPAYVRAMGGGGLKEIYFLKMVVKLQKMLCKNVIL